MSFEGKNKMHTGSKVKELICLQECVAPGLGAWKKGDIVKDPKLVEHFIGNPNFAENKSHDGGKD